MYFQSVSQVSEVLKRLWKQKYICKVKSVFAPEALLACMPVHLPQTDLSFNNDIICDILASFYDVLVLSIWSKIIQYTHLKWFEIMTLTFIMLGHVPSALEGQSLDYRRSTPNRRIFMEVKQKIHNSLQQPTFYNEFVFVQHHSFVLLRPFHNCIIFSIYLFF